MSQSARIKVVHLTNKCFIELSVKANEFIKAHASREYPCQTNASASFPQKIMNFKKNPTSGRSRGFELALCSDSIRAVFGFEWRGVRIRLARCLDSQPLTTKCLSELPVRAHEFRRACGILEILRIRLGAVFGFDWHGVRIRVAWCSDSTGAVFGFDMGP